MLKKLTPDQIKNILTKFIDRFKQNLIELGNDQQQAETITDKALEQALSGLKSKSNIANFQKLILENILKEKNISTQNSIKTKRL